MVLVSREASYAPVRTRIIVIEVSRKMRGIASEVPLTKRDGLPGRCVANADNVATIPKAWLEERIAVLGDERLMELDRALAFSLGLE